MPPDEKKVVEIGYRTAPTKKAEVEEQFELYAKIVEERKDIDDLNLSKFRRKLDDNFIQMMKAGTPPDYPPRLYPMAKPSSPRRPSK